MSPQQVTALLSPGRAASLLEQVIYEQVLETIDLDRLAGIETMLAMELAELEDLSEEETVDLAKSMIDRALARVPDDPRRYGTFGRPGDSLDCELCEAEARTRTRHQQHRDPLHGD